MIIGLDVKSKVMRCSTCFCEIRSKYFRIDEHSKVMCGKCYENGTVCQICFIPSLETYIVDSVRTCSSCYKKRSSCLSCKRDIVSGQSRYIFGLQGFFCASCYKHPKKCSRCSFPVIDNNSLSRVDSDLLLCLSCSSQAVRTKEVAFNIITNIGVILQAKFGIKVSDFGSRVFVSLVTKDKMANMLQSSNKGKLQKQFFSKNSLDKDKVFVHTASRGEDYIINSIIGLHVRTFISYAAYEYATILSSKFCPFDSSRGIKGGFASFIAIKLLWLLGYHGEIDRISSEYNIYSTNLRKLNFLEKNSGIEGVLAYIKEL